MAYLLLNIGQDGRDIFNTWALTEAQQTVETLFQKFRDHCSPKKRITTLRFRFNSRIQKEGETIDQFVTSLKLLSEGCEFNDLQDSLIRDRIIFGTNDHSIKERLLQEDDPTLADTLRIARSLETSKQELSSMATPLQAMSVHKINKKTTPKSKPPAQNHRLIQRYPNQANAKSSTPQNPKHCPNCGNAPHDFSQCPARNQTCNYCKKLHHFKKMCRKLKYNRQKTHQIELGEEDEEEECTFQVMKINAEEEDEAFVTLGVDLKKAQHKNKDNKLKVKIDTGSQGNALPMRLYKEMFPTHDSEGNPTKLEPSKTRITAYGGHQVKQYGTCKLKCTYKDKSEMMTFFVTEDQGPDIIGLPSLLKLGLITINYEIKCPSNSHSKNPMSQENPCPKAALISQNPHVFNGIGKFQGQYHIHLDPQIPSVIHPQRKVPIKIKKRIKTELDEMESLNIIKKIKVGEPTAWVNSLVYREKQSGRLRLCLDPKDLNKAILREHHTTPTLEEILPSLSGAKFFSILDAKCGYWNVELDEESSYLTTFNSPYGRYRFLRMPFGLKMSQDVFQAKIDQTFEGCNGVIGIADDIVVFGRTQEEHDKNLKEAIQRCKDTGLKLNPDKCKIRQTDIKFYGIICTGEGIRPDPAKVSAIKSMKAPTNEKELSSFLGFATYMGPFIKDFSKMTTPLRELLAKDSKFDWTVNHEQAFQQIKDSISSQDTLAYFNPDKPITVQVDASLKALGATLLQEGRPVAYASKSLTDQETRYANIERELLAVVYGCERFHTYLYAQTFTVETDHRPLESIHLKHLKAAPPRLQRMLLRLQPYDLKIVYKPGKDMAIADALSRLCEDETNPIDGLDVKIHTTLTQFSISCLERIKEATATDTELMALKEIVYNGWPEKQQDVPNLCRPYWNFRDEISIDDGILLKSSRIIIPKKMQREILETLHQPHLGMQKTKLRARETVFWTNINRDIDEIVSRCEICQKYQPAQQKEPLIQTEIPPRPWHTVGTDLFYLRGEEYLLVSDYYSKYPIVRKVPKHESTSQKVVTLTKQIFSEHGIPEVVRSDNGPHFSGVPYRNFAASYGFLHKTSSPHFAKSNGFIESQVKIVKRTLKKAFESSQDPYLSLLALRTTPVDNKLPSPSQMLFNRQLRDTIPRKLLRPTNNKEIEKGLGKRQEVQRLYHDRHAKTLPPLSTNEHVTVQNPVSKRWEPAIITNKSPSPRSYIIERTNTAGDLRRNRSQIRPAPLPNRDDQPTLQTEPAAEPIPQAAATDQPPRPSLAAQRVRREIKPPERLDL